MGKFFLWMTIALVLTFCIVPVCDWLKHVFVYRGDRYWSNRAKYMEQASASGMSFIQAQDTLFLREALARLRDRASSAVRANPTLWFEALAAEKRESIEWVASFNRDLVLIYKRQIDDLSYGHILYPSEARMVDKIMEMNTGFNPTEYQRAALRIVRPG